VRPLLCVLAFAAVVTTACHRPDDYLLSPTLANEVLSVALSATSIPADGISRTTVTAQIDPRTDFDKRTVTFSTTAGTLIADGQQGTTISVTADTTGKTVAELRSSTSATTARIDVSVATIVRTASVQFVQLTRDQVYDLSVSSYSVPADGFSTSLISVTLKRLGTVDQRSVKFETSVGTFIASGQTLSRSVTLTAGASGVVVAELRSDSPGTAYVRVTALDTVEEFQIAFVALTLSDVFDVTVDRMSIPADGFSIAEITATLKRPGGTAQQRTFKVETSAGTLIAAGQGSGRSVSVVADATGRATVELQSDKTVGSARVRVTAYDLPFEFTVNFTSANPSDVVTVTTSGSAPADGISTILVTATVASNLPSGRRLVAFRTTLGTVTPAAIEADGSNTARATITSTTVGDARVTATVDGVTAATSAPFTAAYPDRVFVAPDASTLQTGGSTTIRVTLVRTIGSVSSPLVVTYTATTNTGASIGTFSRVALASGGSATVTFNLGATPYLGPVTITATAEGGTAGSAVIQITP
jgi:adhesin/invasin